MHHSGPKKNWRDLQPVFIDFEASGLTGWPIEIGWAEPVEGQIRVQSYLIRPDPTWDTQEWDDEAEALHGISQNLLVSQGMAAQDMARLTLQALEGRLLMSDAAAYDEKWLRQLLELQPLPSDLIVRDIAWLARHMDAGAQAAMLEILRQDIPAHRAGPDAACLARAWQAALFA